MKYLKHLLILLIIFIPVSVFALGNDIICQSEVKPNESFTCTILSPINCVEALINLELPNGFSLVNNVSSKNYEVVGNKLDLELKYSGFGEHDHNVAVLTIKAPGTNGDYKINFNNIRFKYTNNDSNYTVKNNQSIAIKVKGIIPSTTTKIVETNITVTFVYDDDLNNNRTLSCSLNNGKCLISLDDITSPIKDGYVFNGWSTSKECSEISKDMIEISENTSLYPCFTINDDNSLPYLESLEIVGYEINFSKYNYVYSIRLNDSDDLVINAVPISKDYYLEIDKPSSFIDGVNEVTLTVFGANKSLIYTVLVIKGDSPLVGLKNISISDYELNFKENVFNYDLNINPFIKQLDIEVLKNNDTDTYNIIGNNDLKDGSIIEIKVNDKYDNTVSYYVNINVKSIFEIYQKYILIGLVIVLMLIIYFVVKIIKKNKNRVINTKNKDDKIPLVEPIERL